MIITERVRKSYDAYAQNYDAGTGLQRNLADKLIKAVQSGGVKFSKALDIGCGTGYVTQALCRGGPLWPPDIIRAGTGACPYIYFVGCDISFGMLSCAKNKIQSAHYVQADAQCLPFDAASFDLVVSNAAYQWVFDLKSAFREVSRVLKPCGKFYFVVFNNNTLRELQSICKEINVASSNFPDKAKLVSSLNEAGFKIIAIETFNHKKYYKDLWELLDVLKNIGSTPAENKKISGLGWRKILRQANDLYAAQFGSDKGLPAAYEAFLIKAENA